MTRTSLFIAATFAAIALGASELAAQVNRAGGAQRSAPRSVQRATPRAAPRTPPRTVQRATPRSVQRSTPRSATPRISTPRASTPRTIQRPTPRATAPRSAAHRSTRPTYRSSTPSVSTPRSRAGSSTTTIRRSSPSSTTPRVSTPRYRSTPGGVTPRSSTQSSRRGSSTTVRSIPGGSSARSGSSTRTRALPGSGTNVYRPSAYDRARSSTKTNSSSVRRAVGGSSRSTNASRLRGLEGRARSTAGTNSAKIRANQVNKRLSDRYSTRLSTDLRRIRGTKSSSSSVKVGGNRVEARKAGGATPRKGGSARSDAGATSARTLSRIGTRYRGPSTGSNSTGSNSADGPRSAPRSGIARTLGSPRVARSPARPAAGPAITPTLNPRTPSLQPRTGRFTSAAIQPHTSSYRATLGHANWGNHYSLLTYSWGYNNCSRWGIYAYPFYFGASLPYHYSNCWSSYHTYNYRAAVCWNPTRYWWPRHCATSAWLIGSGWGWDDCYGTDLWYDPTPSYIVIRERTTPTEVVVAGGRTTPAESFEEIASRHLSLGDFYFREGRYDEAAESYTRALAYAPDDGSIHFVIADALFAQGDYHYAAHMIAKGLSLDPELALADTDKRSFYGDAEDFEAHMKTLRGYLADKPYDAAAQFVLAYNLRFSDEREAAETALERVLEIDPGHTAAREFLRALREPPEAATSEAEATPETDK